MLTVRRRLPEKNFIIGFIPNSQEEEVPGATIPGNGKDLDEDLVDILDSDPSPLIITKTDPGDLDEFFHRKEQKETNVL